jgi:radical SAM protein with 4Fe4S-binding SPASM domain
VVFTGAADPPQPVRPETITIPRSNEEAARSERIRLLRVPRRNRGQRHANTKSAGNTRFLSAEAWVVVAVLRVRVTGSVVVPFVNVTELADKAHEPGAGMPLQLRSTVLECPANSVPVGMRQTGMVQLFDVSLETWCGMEASLCVFRRQCGSALALEHSGDVYSCDHFVYPQNKLGNIMEVPCRSWSIRNNKSALGVPRRLHSRVIAVNAMCASPAMGSVPSIGLSRLRTAKQD